MNKEEFINKLRKKLNILEKNEIEDIVEEYEGYIEEKINSGMSETDAVKALGDIDEITKDLLSAYKIKDNYSNNRGINLINNFTDAVMDGIDSFIAIFRHKSSREVAKIIVEIIMLFIIISICRIPFIILSDIGYDALMTFGNTVGSILYHIWDLIINIIYFCLAIIFFFKILKERIIGENTPEVNPSEKKTTSKGSKTNEKSNTKVDAKNERTSIIDVFANIFLFFVKFIVAFIAIGNGFFIAGCSCCLAISIFLICKGVTYFGITLLAIAVLAFSIAIFELLINFIFDRKNNFCKFLIIILSSLIVGGTGMGLFATEIAESSFDTKVPSNIKFDTIEKNIEMQDNIVFPSYYNLIVDEEMGNDIKIVYNYSQEYIDLKVNVRTYDDGEYVIYHPDFNASWSNKTLNRIIKDAKAKKFFDYSKLLSVKIYVNKENYDKLIANRENYGIVNDNCYCINGYCECD